MIYATRNVRFLAISSIGKAVVIFSLILYVSTGGVETVLGVRQPPPATIPTISPHWQTYEELVKDKKISPAGKTLEVVLSYNSETSPKFAITELTQKNGYVPSPSPDAQPYHIQLLDSNKRVLSEQPFDISNQILSETFDPNEPNQSEYSTLSNLSFVLTLPWIDNATQIGITDGQGKRVIISPLSQVRVVDNKPTFQTIRGDELLKLSPQQLNLNFFLRSAHAQEANKVLNIAIIGDGYTDLNAFHEDVNRASQTFLQYEPYKTRASQIAFHTVDNTDNLGCSSIDKCKTAVMQKISNAGVPYEQVAVLLNYKASNMGGSSDGQNFALISRSNEMMPHRFTHEVGGHGIGKLLDEYVVSPNNGTVDDQVHMMGDGSSGPPPGDGNCYAGTPPVAEWNNIINSGDYRKGCRFPNWYASSQGSIMGSSEGPPYPHYFNTVSQCIINRRLDDLVGPFQGGAVPPENCPPPPAADSPHPRAKTLIISQILKQILLS